jgi:cation transport protein ChaC
METINKESKKSLMALTPDKNLWVFGYGSLMWNPEFAYVEGHQARIYGFHRRLCLWSMRYRGTEENPGLVVGMAPGGSCLGMAFRVDDSVIHETMEYLFERELISNAYRPVVKPIHLVNGKKANALTFVSKKEHRQYAPKMSIEKITQIVSNAHGPRGSNSDYIINTADYLENMGIHKTEIHNVAERLKSTSR